MEHNFYRYPNEELYRSLSLSELEDVWQLGRQRVTYHKNEMYTISMKIRSYENRLAELSPDYDSERYDEIMKKIFELKEMHRHHAFKKLACHANFTCTIERWWQEEKRYTEKQSQQKPPIS